jgi:hypothetical protein
VRAVGIGSAQTSIYVVMSRTFQSEPAPALARSHRADAQLKDDEPSRSDAAL